MRKRNEYFLKEKEKSKSSRSSCNFVQDFLDLFVILIEPRRKEKAFRTFRRINILVHLSMVIYLVRWLNSPFDLPFT